MNKKKVDKFTYEFISFGICCGLPLGLLIGYLLYPDNSGIGLCYGLPLGIAIGYALGAAKDKRLSKNMMEITRIEAIADSTDSMITCLDTAKTKKQFRVSDDRMRSQKFAVGERVAEGRKEKLISLED